jgi:hypothetical protein
MEALKYKTIVKNDGEITLSGIPCKKGQEVEMIILIQPSEKMAAKRQFNAIRLNTAGFKFNREESNER